MGEEKGNRIKANTKFHESGNHRGRRAVAVGVLAALALSCIPIALAFGGSSVLQDNSAQPAASDTMTAAAQGSADVPAAGVACVQTSTTAPATTVEAVTTEDATAVAASPDEAATDEPAAGTDEPVAVGDDDASADDATEYESYTGIPYHYVSTTTGEELDQKYIDKDTGLICKKIPHFHDDGTLLVPGVDYVDGQLLVFFYKSAVTEDDVMSSVEAAGCTCENLDDLDSIGLYDAAVDVPSTMTLDEACEIFASVPGVKNIELNLISTVTDDIS